MRATMAVEHAVEVTISVGSRRTFAETRMNGDGVFHVSSPSTNRSHTEFGALLHLLLLLTSRFPTQIQTQSFRKLGSTAFDPATALPQQRRLRTETLPGPFHRLRNSHVRHELERRHELHFPAFQGPGARLNRSRGLSFTNKSATNSSHSNHNPKPKKQKKLFFFFQINEPEPESSSPSPSSSASASSPSMLLETSNR